MSYARPRFEWEFDWLTGALVGLMLLFQVVALYMVQLSKQTFALPEQQASLSLSAWFLGVVAVELAMLLVLFRLYKRLSDKWRKIIKTAIWVIIDVSLGLTVFYIYWANGNALRFFIDVPVAIMVAYLAIKIATASGLKWIGFNMLAFLLGILVVVAFSQQAAPRVILVIMVAFTIYDHIAVNLSNIMGDLIEFSSSAKIPNFFVVPNRLRVDLDPLFEFMRGETTEKPKNIATVIGLGDYIFPTLLAASAAVKYGLYDPIVVLTVLGTIGAFPILRAATIRLDGSVPALPWLNSGAICGFTVGLLITL